jgi:hypothetical protein
MLPPVTEVYHVTADVCIYGATVAGIAAAIQAQRMGRSAALLSFDGYIGGITTSGLGATDIGDAKTITGIAQEFYQRVGAHYGLTESWYFEPHVAADALRDLCDEAGVDLFFRQRLTGIQMADREIVSITTEGGHTFQASYFVDASYEGDLMAAAGVSYTVGREGNAKYGETLNGVQVGTGNGVHNFRRPVDPYTTQGDPKSGLLHGISTDPPGVSGQADQRLQAYNFRLCLTQASNRLPFPKPDDYDAERYELLLRYINVMGETTDALSLTTWLPNGKTDTNNWGAFSSDNIGRNYRWAEGTYGEREVIFQDHVTYHQGLMWFLANDPRVPQPVRTSVQAFGLPTDEFTNTGGWPHQLYIREARRMISDYVMTEHHCRGKVVATDGIALGSYTMDSHHCQRVALLQNGVATARNEGDFEAGPVTPYPISYRSIIPQASECPNLLVPVCLSASHVAWGSIRVEPTYFALGQAAGAAASLAIESGPHTPLTQVPIGTLQARLRSAGKALS